MIDSKIKYKWYICDLYKKIMPAVLDDHDSISRSKMSNALVTGTIKKLGNSIEQYIENED